jgi:hypothetical protein
VKNLAEKIEALRKKRGEYDALRKRIERTGESQISLTDPDGRAMATHTKLASATISRSRLTPNTK